MGMGQSKAATNQLNTTNAAASGASQEEQNLYGSVQPFLQQEMTNPTAVAAPGITAANEALGGATAGAVGQGALNAARTRNSAGQAPALDQSVRQAGQTQSGNILGETNAIQQAGAAGQQGLLNTEAQQTDSLYGLGPSTLQAGKQPGWFQTMVGDLGTLSGAALNASKV